MKENLTLEMIAPYLPYELGTIYKLSNVIVLSPEQDDELRHKVLTLDNIDFILKYCKPLLHSQSKLTRKIEHNNEKSIPILELCKLAQPLAFFTKEEWNISVSEQNFISIKSKMNIYSFEFDLKDCEMMVYSDNELQTINDRYELYKKLFEMHFAINIPKHLYIEKE